MINIDRHNIMTEECLQNYKKFLKRKKEQSSQNGFFALEGYDRKTNEDLFPSIKKIERRQEDDPTYQGCYAVEILDRRKNAAPVFQNSKRIEWIKFPAKNILGDEFI